MRTLFEKSGAEGTYRRFKFEILRIVVRNDLPGFVLTVRPGGEAEPVLHMLRREFAGDGEAPFTISAQKQSPRPKPKAEPIAAAPRSLPLLHPILRNLSDRCILRVRTDFPGWDIYALKAEFDSWLDEDAKREPRDYEGAFYGFVRQHHHRNRHQVS